MAEPTAVDRTLAKPLTATRDEDQHHAITQALADRYAEGVDAERARAAAVARAINPHTITDHAGALLFRPGEEFSGLIKTGIVIAGEKIAAAIERGETP